MWSIHWILDDGCPTFTVLVDGQSESRMAVTPVVSVSVLTRSIVTRAWLCTTLIYICKYTNNQQIDYSLKRRKHIGKAVCMEYNFKSFWEWRDNGMTNRILNHSSFINMSIKAWNQTFKTHYCYWFQSAFENNIVWRILKDFSSFFSSIQSTHLSMICLPMQASLLWVRR